MKFITVATHKNKHLERLLTSCSYHGIELEILGLGKQYEFHYTKLKLIREYLEEIDANELVCYVDAYDVVFLSGPEEIELKFLSMNHPFVVAAEMNYKFIAPYLIKLWYFFRYKKGHTPYNYINAGTFLGRAGYLKELIESMKPIVKTCDQTMFSRHYVNHEGSIVLDRLQNIFACTAGRTGLELMDYSIKNNRLQNNVTETFPCILHTPGKNFVGLDLLCQLLPEEYSKYNASESELKEHQFRSRRNGLIARTTKDNYLFHFILHLTAVLGVLIGLIMLFWYFF